MALQLYNLMASSLSPLAGQAQISVYRDVIVIGDLQTKP